MSRPISIGISTQYFVSPPLCERGSAPPPLFPLPLSLVRSCPVRCMNDRMRCVKCPCCMFIILKNFLSEEKWSVENRRYFCIANDSSTCLTTAYVYNVHCTTQAESAHSGSDQTLRVAQQRRRRRRRCRQLPMLRFACFAARPVGLCSRREAALREIHKQLKLLDLGIVNHLMFCK